MCSMSADLFSSYGCVLFLVRGPPPLGVLFVQPHRQRYRTRGFASRISCLRTCLLECLPACVTTSPPCVDARCVVCVCCCCCCCVAWGYRVVRVHDPRPAHLLGLGPGISISWGGFAQPGLTAWTRAVTRREEKCPCGIGRPCDAGSKRASAVRPRW